MTKNADAADAPGAELAYFSPPPPRILAHRGFIRDASPRAAGGVPRGGRSPGAGEVGTSSFGDLSPVENTHAAFAAALALGASHLETDAHVTADGVAVLWHDPTLERFDGSRLTIADERWPALAKRRSQGAELMTLADALAEFPGARFNIDVKTPAAAEPVARAVVAARASGRVLLTSFTEANARAAWRHAPDAARGATRERIAAALAAIEVGSDRMLRRALRDIDAVQVPERALGLSLVHPKRLPRLRRHVREVHVWTVNDETAMVRLWRAGVDGIVTDRTDLAVAARASIAATASSFADGSPPPAVSAPRHPDTPEADAAGYEGRPRV
ncbi:hypothetical protein GCM10011490_02710 [Pseudoclavibacter endophyticus]|uniref:glycerophosphodiester phosphodiesterase family protein n=1 Tax=Pseudoclavibacter endophyticus TaxID=1778590 RepID=UPI00166596F0|nr:glycerophosphodiester phosphodiesterase family protein [Pseudoclavibacter endophyticus]GGA56298.1 hypothetical protein GCM10011490_02710 [Pseudoclavibacter endophyticus]